MGVSEKIGFTVKEIRIVLFLVGVLMVGGGIRFFLWRNNVSDYKNFDYSFQDSLFYADSLGDEISTSEVLGSDSVAWAPAKSEPVSGSINLNTAGAEELTLIPGIGKVTAENIIKIRNQKGKFRRLDELLEVKRIGQKTFNKIRRYLYIYLL